MKKNAVFRLMRLLLCCAFLVGLTSAAFAQNKPDAQRYPDADDLLMVSGAAVTQESLEGVFLDGPIDYDFETRTLTIRSDIDGCGALALYSSVRGLTIYVENNVTLYNEDGNVVTIEADATITGPGKLIVRGQGEAGAAILVSGDATLTLEDCSLEACNHCGMMTSKVGAYPEEGGGGLVIRNSTVRAEGANGAVTGFDGCIWLSDCAFTQPEGAVIDADTNGLYSVYDSGHNLATAVQIVPQLTVCHTVHFEMNGHGRALDDVQLKDGEKLEKPGDPSEEGWSFGGWYIDGQLTKAYDFSQPVSADLTLYAKWTKTAISFTDVDTTQYYAEPVAWAVENGVTNGTGTNTFSPDKTCTRGQIVTFLWRAKGSPEPTSTENPFTDVSENDYYYKAVLWAKETGVTSGTSATKFSPGKGCTRGQVVTFLWRAEGEPEPGAKAAVRGDNELPIIPIQPTPKSPFDDVTSNAYYFKAVLWAMEQGITNGTSATTFSPDKTCTRGQIVTFLYRDLG